MNRGEKRSLWGWNNLGKNRKVKQTWPLRVGGEKINKKKSGWDLKKKKKKRMGGINRNAEKGICPG